jgi:hypothetical protein
VSGDTARERRGQYLSIRSPWPKAIPDFLMTDPYQPVVQWAIFRTVSSRIL